MFYDTDDFDVLAGNFFQAWNNGPHQDRPWDVDIATGVQRFYANIFRAARRYHDGFIGGLRRPNVWAKLKYNALDKDKKRWNGYNEGNTLRIIKLARYDGDREFNSDEIFSTTIHETAHSSHSRIMNIGDIQLAFSVNAIIRESWPTAIELYITQMEYRERGIPNYGAIDDVTSEGFPSQRGYQLWNGTNTEYTPLFIDLVDNFNQRGLGSRVNDNITGFTLEQIEPLLKHVYGLYTLGKELKTIKQNGVTDAQIDEFLA